MTDIESKNGGRIEIHTLMAGSTKISHFFDVSITQSGFQSELETAPLAAVSAGYCHFLGQFQAKSST